MSHTILQHMVEKGNEMLTCRKREMLKRVDKKTRKFEDLKGNRRDTRNHVQRHKPSHDSSDYLEQNVCVGKRSRERVRKGVGSGLNLLLLASWCRFCMIPVRYKQAKLHIISGNCTIERASVSAE